MSNKENKIMHCENCGYPTKGKNSLCYDCKQAEEESKIADIDLQMSREFKADVREALQLNSTRRMR